MLIDPDRQYAEFYLQDEAGLYRVAFCGSEGVYRSRVLEGFWCGWSGSGRARRCGRFSSG